MLRYALGKGIGVTSRNIVLVENPCRIFKLRIDLQKLRNLPDTMRLNLVITPVERYGLKSLFSHLLGNETGLCIVTMFCGITPPKPVIFRCSQPILCPVGLHYSR